LHEHGITVIQSGDQAAPMGQIGAHAGIDIRHSGSCGKQYDE
jgi:hypothetical protein